VDGEDAVLLGRVAGTRAGSRRARAQANPRGET
jgi:hypothetical protein